MKSFVYDTSTVVETEGATDTFAMTWGAIALNRTSFCNAIQNHHSSSGQKVRNPNFKSQKSSEVLAGDHIRATEQWNTVRNSCRDTRGTLLDDLIKTAVQWKTVRINCRDKCAQCCQHFKTARNADQPLNALMKWIVRHAAWLIPRFKETNSPRSIEPWVVGILEGRWNLVNLCKWKKEKDWIIPHRTWLTSGNPPCGWARATSQLVRKKTFEQLSKHHRNRSR